MGKRLFVGNLSFDTSEADLLQFIGDDAVSASVITDRETGKSRGFGFVEMVSDAAAHTAIERCDGQQLDGRALRINEAEERSRPGGGAARGGSFQGGGGQQPRGGGGGRREDRRRGRGEDSW